LKILLPWLEIRGILFMICMNCDYKVMYRVCVCVYVVVQWAADRAVPLTPRWWHVWRRHHRRQPLLLSVLWVRVLVAWMKVSWLSSTWWTRLRLLRSLPINTLTTSTSRWVTRWMGVADRWCLQWLSILAKMLTSSSGRCRRQCQQLMLPPFVSVSQTNVADTCRQVVYRSALSVFAV